MTGGLAGRRSFLALLALTACGAPVAGPTDPVSSLPTTTSLTTLTASSVAGPTVGATDAAPVVVGIRVTSSVDDVTTDDFERDVASTLTDPRGWGRAGFVFTFDDPEAAYVVVLDDGPAVDALCLPYDTYGLYSCQNGPVVALNADRWRSATPEWTGDLATYRQMLVNHEVGHLLGQHHPHVACPGAGEAAPVMAQQSTELDACIPNPWPLEWEVRCAARHEESLAPAYEPHPASDCGP